MHLLHKALDADGELRATIDNLNRRISANPFKQALILDVNPYWLVAVSLEKCGLSDELFGSFLFDRLRTWGNEGWLLRPGAATSLLRSSGISTSIDDVDLKRSSRFAQQSTLRVFGQSRKDSPFLLRIFAYSADDALSRSREAGRSFDGGARSQLVEAARETPIATIVETQPQARFIAGTADRVFSSDGKYGTLGGFLRDGGTLYGVTCGHVIAQGDYARTADERLGHVKHAASPAPLLSGVICDRHCTGKTDLDVALIDLESGRATCAAASVVETISIGDLVEMDGAISGHKLYEVGPIVVDIEIKRTCWDRLFLIHAPISNSAFDPGVNVLLTSMPAEGDSGAWLFRDSDQWVGMVIATSPLYAYALAGTTIIANSNNRFSTNLALPDVSPVPKPTRGWRAFANLLGTLSR